MIILSFLLVDVYFFTCLYFIFSFFYDAIHSIAFYLQLKSERETNI